MSIWNSLFGVPTLALPALQSGMFGRYSDNYKTAKQRKAWSLSLETFRQGSYLDQIEAFLIYVSDGPSRSATWQRVDGKIQFEIQQGSRAITGWADAHQMQAESHIAQIGETDLVLMRRLVEQNYRFKHVRYALDENNHIVLIFSTYMLDAYPHKLYTALRELALMADKQDDLLVNDFASLTPLHQDRGRTNWDDTANRIRHGFLVERIDGFLALLQHSSLDNDRLQQVANYGGLGVLYKLDYLLKSEGFLMDQVEQARKSFLSDQDLSPAKKGEQLLERLEELRNRPFDLYRPEWYQVIHTFGITQAEPHVRFKGLAEEELKRIEWYANANLTDVVLALTDHLVGQALFSYAWPQPLRDLLHLYLEITEPDFFKQLGFKQPAYLDTNSQVQTKTVKAKIADIIKEHADVYPRLDLSSFDLPSTQLSQFCVDFIRSLTKLDLTQ
jgi:hypothetical protein